MSIILYLMFNVLYKMGQDFLDMQYTCNVQTPAPIYLGCSGSLILAAYFVKISRAWPFIRATLTNISYTQGTYIRW